MIFSDGLFVLAFVLPPAAVAFGALMLALRRTLPGKLPQRRIVRTA
jgi:hypothetical protein